MAGTEAAVVRVVSVADGDLRELEELTGALRAELLDTDADAVEPAEAVDLPEGAKGLGTLAGWLAVQFGSVEGLRSVLDAVRQWAARNDRTVEISLGSDVLKVTGVSSAQQDRLIEVWLDRQRASA